MQCHHTVLFLSYAMYSHCTFCSYINKCHRTFVPVPSHCTSFFLFKFNTQCTSALTLYFFSFVDHIPVSVPSHCTVFSLYTMYQCPHTVLSLFIHKKCHHTLYQCHHTVPSFSCSVSITQCTSAITLYSSFNAITLCLFFWNTYHTICTSAITLYFLFYYSILTHSVSVPSHCTPLLCFHSIITL